MIQLPVNPARVDSTGMALTVVLASLEENLFRVCRPTRLPTWPLNSDVPCVCTRRSLEVEPQLHALLPARKVDSILLTLTIHATLREILPSKERMMQLLVRLSTKDRILPNSAHLKRCGSEVG